MRFLKAVVATLSPDCRDVAKLQSTLLHQDLFTPRRLGVRMHLLLCAWCRRYGHRVQLLRQAAHEDHELMNEIPPDQLTPQARERIKRSLSDGQK